MRVAWVALVLLMAAPVRAQSLDGQVQEQSRAMAEEARQGTQAYSILKSLTTEVGPRQAGSDGDARAVAWAVRTMKELGLSNVRTQPVSVPVWVRGEERGRITEPFAQPVVLTALGGSVATPAGGIEAEVVEALDHEALAAMDRTDVEGRIVFLSRRMARTPDGEGYAAVSAMRSRGPSIAASLGAVAVLTRSLSTSTSRVAHTGGFYYAAEHPEIPAAALSNPDADLLAAQIATGKPVRFHLTLGCRRADDGRSANVIGEVPGRERPEEIVLLGAHLDSWDVGTAAVDDGAGCAIMLEVARRIAALPEPPRRTVRVVLFANEEWGWSGGVEYAKGWDIDAHVLALEADAGAGPAFRLDSRVAEEKLALVSTLHGLVAPLGIERGHEQAWAGADLFPLRICRVPMLELVFDQTFYFDVHHSHNDTLAVIDPRDLDHNVAATLALAWGVVEMDGDLRER